MASSSSSSQSPLPLAINVLDSIFEILNDGILANELLDNYFDHSTNSFNIIEFIHEFNDLISQNIRQEAEEDDIILISSDSESEEPIKQITSIQVPVIQFASRNSAPSTSQIPASAGPTASAKPSQSASEISSRPSPSKKTSHASCEIPSRPSPSVKAVMNTNTANTNRKRKQISLKLSTNRKRQATPLNAARTSVITPNSGGFKAVIWTDAVQTVIMIVAVLWITVAGTKTVGGFDIVWKYVSNSSHLDVPTMKLDFTSRYSIWGIVFGFTTSVLDAAFNQGTLQRCMCLPTLTGAKWCMGISFIVMPLIMIVAAVSGYVIFAAYYDCDPLSAQVHKMTFTRLDLVDYIVLLSMFISCFAIGIYYGFFKGKISKTQYLIGNKDMNVFPVAMSIVASALSSTLFVGRTTEVYLYGASVFYVDFAVPILVVIFVLFYLPVFYNLETVTVYEYLLLRFDRKVHLLATILVTLQILFVSPVVLYVPALAFNEVTGINLHVVVLVTCLICVFYTCVGGFTAVIYTDTIQTVVMLTSLLIINMKGTGFAGGFDFIWAKNYESGRLNLAKTDLDFTQRYTMWAIFIGYAPSLMSYICMNQSTMQRCRSVRSLNSARSALLIYVVVAGVLFAVISYSGFMLFAVYKDCDPLTSQIVKKKDQILPYFITNALANVTGIRGLFLAGVFSAGLSTVSTSLNTLSGIFLQDFYISLTNKQISEDKGSFIMKICVAILGVLFTGMTLFVDKMGTIYQITASLSGLINGPIFGIFTIGIFIPAIQSKAVLIGTIVGFFSTVWIYVGSLLNNNRKINLSNDFSVKGCIYNTSMLTVPASNNTTNENVFSMYNISFFWYAIIGFILTLVVSCLVSIFTERNDVSSMDMKLFSPLIKPKRRRKAESSAMEMKLLK